MFAIRNKIVHPERIQILNRLTSMLIESSSGKTPSAAAKTAADIFGQLRKMLFSSEPRR